MSIADTDLQILKLFNHPSAIGIDIYIVTGVFAVYAVLIYLVYHYFKHNYTSKFAHIVLASIIGYLLVTLIKYIVARPRPYADNSVNPVITKPYDPYSFPSGHSFVAGLLLNFLPPTWPKSIKYLMTGYIIFVPVASIYIGIHYPSDVLVGTLFGYLFPKIFSEKLSFRMFKKISNLHLR